MRAAYLLSPSFITQGRMGASKAALILMKNSHFDRTLQYYAQQINGNQKSHVTAIKKRSVFSSNFESKLSPKVDIKAIKNQNA